MAKYLKKDKKRTVKRILVMTAIIIVVLALIAAIVVSLHPELLPAVGEGTAPQQMQGATENDGTAVTEPTETQLPALEYPLMLENGKLKIENLFQYEGLNPDCALEDGKNVASITLRNMSGEYLEKADIILTLVDGTVVKFTVNDLPAGKTVMAFSVDNTPAEENASCADAACTASWSSETVLMPEGVSVDVDGVTITVTNNTGSDISGLVISCRCPLDEEYFGGTAYQYTINNLPANESATVEAWDCILGMAEVVRIAVNQE